MPVFTTTILAFPPSSMNTTSLVSSLDEAFVVATALVPVVCPSVALALGFLVVTAERGTESTSALVLVIISTLAVIPGLKGEAL